MQNKIEAANERGIHQKVDDILLYINGKFTPAMGNSSFENRNPFSNEVINHVSEGREEDIKAAVDAAGKAFSQGPWGKMKLEKRMEYINRIADVIDEEIEEIAYLEALDTGLPISQTKKMTARAAENFRFYAGMVQAGFR